MEININFHIKEFYHSIWHFFQPLNVMGFLPIFFVIITLIIVAIATFKVFKS